jgi:predicted CoA-binding protein
MTATAGRLLATASDIDALLARTRRVAVLGIKTEAQRDQPAFSVAEYLANSGLDVVPVPVYYPDVTTILGKPVFRRVADVPGEIDLVDVFRRAQDVPAHVDDILAKHPAAVWMQLGIRNEEAAARLTAAGIDVVQDRCLLVEHRRWTATRARDALELRRKLATTSHLTASESF